jgi:type I restriction enzyme M protein
MSTSEPRALTRVTPVITGELKSKIDRVWDAFWSGGISNPLEVIEQITYLLFIRRLDDIQTLAEKKARVTRIEVESPVFLPGQAHLRWGQFKNTSPEEHMKDARFTIPTPALLSKVVDMLDACRWRPRHQGRPVRVHALQDRVRRRQNGQFRTPRHIIRAHGQDDRAQPPTT